MSDLLSVSGLETHFYVRGGVTKVLNGLDLSVRRGEIVGLVGPSGTGKSVLVASILSLVKPPGKIVAGRVLFNGEDLLTVNEARLKRIRGKEISLIAANPHTLLNPLIPVGQQVANFLMAHHPVSKKAAMNQVLDMFKQVGIPDPLRRLGNYPHELSGGMAQRVVISIGLICSPQLLLADEPTFGLDVTIQAQVLELMKSLLAQRPEAGMLLVTRDLGIVANYCDRVAIMHQGRIIESGETRDLWQAPKQPYTREILGAATLDYAESRQDTPRANSAASSED
jgi:ABC-type dipeptide/oligopeptide/nickel transport system ATPase component